MKPVSLAVDYNIFKTLTFDYDPGMVQYIDKEVFHESWEVPDHIYNLIHEELYDEY